MKVYSSENIRELERRAQEAGTPVMRLMERAGSAVAESVPDPRGKKITVLCGKGNNGGDGFIAAEKLFSLGAGVTVLLACGEPAASPAKEAFAKLPGELPIFRWKETPGAEEAVKQADVIIDAVFGFGFRGKPQGELEELLELANRTPALKIAADLPSGAECDTGRVEGACFRADRTVTFTGRKPAHVLYPAAEYCGTVTVVSVGIGEEEVKNFPAAYSVIDPEEVERILPQRDPQSNKGDFGRLLLVCGSWGMAGACIMAARGALRSGAGLVEIAVPEQLYPLVAPAVPEAVFTVLEETDSALPEAVERASAVVLGCGLGAGASKALKTVLKTAECPVIIDADGINALVGHIDRLALARCPVILTPHPGEMARLLGVTPRQVQDSRYETAVSFARERGVLLVLKGSGTLIASPEGEVWLNLTGNAGMAKGGSGDVLAGIIGALAAQGISPPDACRAGVYLHGRAGDLCARELSQTAMLPTDLIGYLPRIFLELGR